VSLIIEVAMFGFLINFDIQCSEGCLLSLSCMLLVARWLESLNLAEVVRGRSAITGEKPTKDITTQPCAGENCHQTASIDTTEVSVLSQQSCCTHKARIMSSSYEGRTSVMIRKGRDRHTGKA
jgi:hypothetical protein